MSYKLYTKNRACRIIFYRIFSNIHGACACVSEAHGLERVVGEMVKASIVFDICTPTRSTSWTLGCSPRQRIDETSIGICPLPAS